MREAFPGVIEWQRGIRARARAGELLDNGFGHLLRPDPRRAHTQAPALVGQSCARDPMMEGMLRLATEILPMVRVIVHDEIVLSAPADIAADVENAVVRGCTFEWAPPGTDLTVTVEANPGPLHGHNWGEVYKKK